MRRARVRIWWLMALVAVVAFTIAAKMRHDRCTERARFYAAKAIIFRTNAQMWNSWAGRGDISSEVEIFF